MTTATFPLDVKALEKTWAAFDRVAHLRPIRNDAEYERTVALRNGLLDIVGDQEGHALVGLFDLVSELVEDYDAEHYAIDLLLDRGSERVAIEIKTGRGDSAVALRGLRGAFPGVEAARAWIVDQVPGIAGLGPSIARAGFESAIDGTS